MPAVLAEMDVDWCAHVVAGSFGFDAAVGIGWDRNTANECHLPPAVYISQRFLLRSNGATPILDTYDDPIVVH